MTDFWPLWCYGFLAGAVDAIGGGGGLISIPALMSFGIPGGLLLGTNKCMATLGSSMAVFRYSRAQLMNNLNQRAWFSLVLLGILGGSLGASISQFSFFVKEIRNCVPILLLAIACYLAWKWFFQTRGPVRASVRPDLHTLQTRSVLGLIATYDGFFGPGTGTFFLSYFEKKGLSTLAANANAKVLNISSNFGALLFFAIQSKVDWPVGISCAGAFLVGNYLGASMTLKGGQKLVRLTVLAVTLTLTIKLWVFQ